MAAKQISTTCSVLLALGFVLVTVGSALMWNFSYASLKATKYPVTQPEKLRYDISYFYFIWIASLVTALFQRPNLMAINAGLLAAIITFNFSFDVLDTVRISLNQLQDCADNSLLPQVNRDNCKADREEYQKIAAGCILAYVGAGLSFIASVLVFPRKINSENTSLLTKAVVAFVVLFNFIGCICIWQSRSLAIDNPAVGVRSALFEATECTTAVGIVFLIGIFCGIDHVLYFGAAISGFYNLSIIDTYLQYKDLMDKDAQAGTVMLWLSAVTVAIYCAISRHSPYSSLDGSSEV